MRVQIITEVERKLAEEEKKRAEKRAYEHLRKGIIKADGRPFNLPEWLFTTAQYVVFALTLFFILLDTITSYFNNQTQLPKASNSGIISFLFPYDIDPNDYRAVLKLPLHSYPLLSLCFLVLSIVLLALILIDLASFKPRLFVLATITTPSNDFFSQLGELSFSLRNYMSEIEATPVTSYKNLKQMEELIILEANYICVLDNLRRSITIRAILRLFSLVLALSLVAYFLTCSTGGHFIRNIAPDAGLLRHIYYTSVVFFTIGFGDITPYPSPLGYFFVVGCSVLLIIVTYFIFSNLLSGYFEFQANVKEAAHNFVVSYSKLKI